VVGRAVRPAKGRRAKPVGCHEPEFVILLGLARRAGSSGLTKSVGLPVRKHVSMAGLVFLTGPLHSSHKEHLMSISTVAGVDLSKSDFYAIIRSHAEVLSPPCSFSYDEQGLAAFFALVKAHQVTHVAFESTGGYERHFFQAVTANGLTPYQLEPLSVQQLARSFKRPEKTDKLDCDKIALAALVHQPDSSYCPTQSELDLRQAFDFRAQLVSMRTSLQNQREKREHEANKGMQAWFERQQKELFEQLNKQIKQAEKMMHQLVQADEALKAKAKLLMSMPGVGKVSACGLMAKLPELGSLTPKACAKLVGLAPRCNQSGTKDGARRTQKSRLSVKALLWMASLSAGRMEGPFKDFYDKLVHKKNKHASVARVALMRRMVCALNAMVRDGKPFDEAMVKSREKDDTQETQAQSSTSKKAPSPAAKRESKDKASKQRKPSSKKTSAASKKSINKGL
jgi:transposase